MKFHGRFVMARLKKIDERQQVNLKRLGSQF